MGASWGGVKAALGLSAAAWRRRRGGVKAAWGLHLNGRRMYLSYFVLVNVLVFVLVDEHLIWYSCIYLVMSLLQHFFVPLSRMVFSI